MDLSQSSALLVAVLFVVGCNEETPETPAATEAKSDPEPEVDAKASADVEPEVVVEEEQTEVPIGVTVLEPGKPADAALAAPTETGVARPVRLQFSATKITLKNQRPLLFPTVRIAGTHMRTGPGKGALQMTSLELGPGPGFTEEQTAAVAAEVKAGTASYELGEWSEIKSLDWPAATSAAGSSELAALAKHAFAHLSLPLPTDPIGQGGRFAIKREVDVLGKPYTQTIRLKIKKVYGAQVHVEGKVDYEGTDTDSKGSGTFTARLDLPSGIPIELHLKGTLRTGDDTVRFDARLDEDFLAGGDARVTFDGRFTRGGLVLGKVAPETKVWLDRDSVKVSADGDFLLAFGRDYGPRARLGFQFPGGEIERHIAFVEQREFEPEKIDGLPPEMVDYDKATRNALAKSKKRISKVRDKTSDHTFFKDGWRWPLKGKITSTYGRKRILNGQDKGFHWGLDVAAPVGKKVRAPAPGIVVFAEEDVPLSGTLLILDHGHGLTSSFLHLKQITVKVGDTVKAGQVIAKSGNSGRSTGPHLDWRMNLRGTRVDPQLLVEKR